MLRRLAIELLCRQPATFADLVNGEIGSVVAGQHQVEQSQPGQPIMGPQPEQPQLEETQPGESQEPQPGQPGNETPNWCNCGLCRNMPTQEQNKCCCANQMPCITIQLLFSRLVVDGNVPEIAMRYREDVLVYENLWNNGNFRHAAYKTVFVLWQHRRLGKGNRRAIPSCCVLAICHSTLCLMDSMLGIVPVGYDCCFHRGLFLQYCGG